MTLDPMIQALFAPLFGAVAAIVFPRAAGPVGLLF